MGSWFGGQYDNAIKHPDAGRASKASASNRRRSGKNVLQCARWNTLSTQQYARRGSNRLFNRSFNRSFKRSFKRSSNKLFRRRLNIVLTP